MMLSMGGGGDSSFTMKMIVFALMMVFLVPIMFSLYVPLAQGEGEYEKQIKQLEEDYYLASGNSIIATTEPWALTGIYTPFDGINYGYTPDGWIYSSKIKTYEPLQYKESAGAENPFRVEYNDADGLYYYTLVPSSDKEHTPATPIRENPDDESSRIIGYDFTNASMYTGVTMDNDHKSDVFFTPAGKVVTDSGYYYEYSGYRYAFAPLREYQAYIGGQETTIKPNSSSLSLIWYQYSSYSGIAGQLTISGSDSGLSYLTSQDILRAFNQATYSSTFDMTFNNVAMHLTIRLDAVRMTTMDVETCYNNGYWSVFVTSDAIASSSINDASYDFNADNIFHTLIKLFMFDITDDYDIDGWLGIVASLLVSMPLYAALIVIALDHYIVLIGVALLAVIQGLASTFSRWPF